MSTPAIIVLEPGIPMREAGALIGELPCFVDDKDPRPAREQFNANYQHGGGWLPFGQGQWTLNFTTWTLSYPGDPPLYPVAIMKLRDERIVIYRHAIVMILQPDNSFEVARMD